MPVESKEIEMITSFDKAIVALLGALLSIAAAFGLKVDWATPEVITSIGGVLTALLVYVVPNKAKQ